MTSLPTVLYLGAETGLEAARATLEGHSHVQHCLATPEAVAEALPDAVALLDASMKVRMDNSMLATATQLKIISCATTGSDHIAREHLDAQGIPVRTLRDDRELLLNITPAAELTFGLLLALARKLCPAVQHVREGGWDRELFPGMMLNGRRLGIIGCGRIGSWMARYGRAFGMEIVGFDPYTDPLPEGITSTSLPAMFQSCDAVTVHVHLSEETTGLVSAELLQQAKPGLLLLNTSRGAIVDEAALLKGLVSGRIGGAGADVLSDEPDIERSALLDYARSHDNMLITPHCGGFSPDAVAVVCRRAAEKIRDAIK